MTMKGHVKGHCMERTRELGVHAGITEAIWKFHYFFFGSIFALLTFLVLVSVLGLIRDDRQKKFQRRHYFLWVNCALFYFLIVMTTEMLCDPWENRGCLEPHQLREALHLISRLRLPCLAVAFSLIQLSLLHVSELTIYTTWFHNVVVVFVANLAHFAVVLITGISSIFITKTTIIWIVSDLCMFFVFVVSCLVALYTGTRIVVRHCRRQKSPPASIEGSFQTKNTSKQVTTGEDNLGYVISNGDDLSTTISIEELKAPAVGDTKRRETNVSNASSNLSVTNQEVCLVSTRNALKKVTGVARSCSHTKHRATLTRHRFGSSETTMHASKFCDKSLRKVSLLMNVVGLFGLVMCVTIVISISEAKIFTGDNVKAWEWYLLRTLRRCAEAGVTGTMAYLVRRPPTLL